MKITKMSDTQLKSIAIAAMTVDHISTIYLIDMTIPYAICQFVGNTAFTFMAFFLVEGFHHTRSKKKYVLRLFISGVNSEPFFFILFDRKMNIMFTLIICLVTLEIYTRNGSYGLIIATIFIFLYSFVSMFFDWSFIAPIFVLIYEMMRERKLLCSFALSVAYLLLDTVFIGASLGNKELTLLKMASSFLSIFIPSVFLLSHHGDGHRKKSLPTKLFFYFYYPFHLFILALFSL